MDFQVGQVPRGTPVDDAPELCGAGPSRGGCQAVVKRRGESGDNVETKPVRSLPSESRGSIQLSANGTRTRRDRKQTRSVKKNEDHASLTRKLNRFSD
jgi:hypothetical protein